MFGPVPLNVVPTAPRDRLRFRATCRRREHPLSPERGAFTGTVDRASALARWIDSVARRMSFASKAIAIGNLRDESEAPADVLRGVSAWRSERPIARAEAPLVLDGPGPALPPAARRAAVALRVTT